jgi:hypothetical protein
MLYFIWYFGRCNLDAHWRETEWEHFWSYAWLRWLRNPSLLFSSFQQFFWEREREQLHVSWLKCLDYLSCCISVVVPVYVWDREISFRLLYRSWLWHAPIYFGSWNTCDSHVLFFVWIRYSYYVNRRSVFDLRQKKHYTSLRGSIDCVTIFSIYFESMKFFDNK